MIKKIIQQISTPIIGSVVLTVAGLSLTSSHIGTPNKAKQPNIIFILADDLGTGDVGCYGADNYKTPNIDKLASDGIRFTHAYTPSLSGPSRACILTGRYGFHTGGSNQDAVGRIKPADETLISSIMKSKGYTSSLVGKWSQFSLTPKDFGFDDYLIFKGSGKYWNTQPKGESYQLNGEIVPLKDKEYLPDRMHNHIVDFLTQNQNKPFFLYYSMSHVHSEILPTPDSKIDSKNLYKDNVVYMDKLVGKLREELKRLKLDENTILVFFGDNGTANVNSDRATIGGRRLCGQKGTMLEGGSLVPLLVYWKGVTPKSTVSDALVNSVDFLPTFADIAGAELPQGKIIDGQSFTSLIHGKTENARTNIFIQLGNKWYVRSLQYKLTQTGELYDMSKAPFEEILVTDEANKPAAIAARKSLQAELDRLNPAGGILDDGDGTGRHTNRAKNKIKSNTDQGDE